VTPMSSSSCGHAANGNLCMHPPEQNKTYKALAARFALVLLSLCPVYRQRLVHDLNSWQGATRRALYPCHSYLSSNVNVRTGCIELSFRHSLDHSDAYVDKRLSKENRDEVESRAKAGAKSAAAIMSGRRRTVSLVG
jgi:hypothetical protein